MGRGKGCGNIDVCGPRTANPSFHFVQSMIVIALEGTHGSGKSTLVQKFRDLDFKVLDEAFMDMPSYALHPQTMTMECVWMANWFTRLLKLKEEATLEGDENRIYIADRSPLSAVYYAANGQYLEPVIRCQIDELRNHGIEIYTVHISVEPEVLWQRIQARLAREPARIQFGEGSRQWMDRTLSWYNSMRWDFTIHTDSELTPDQLIHRLLGVFDQGINNWHVPPYVAIPRCHAFPVPAVEVTYQTVIPLIPHPDGSLGEIIESPPEYKIIRKI